LQNAFRGDARRIGFDRRLVVRRLAGVLRSRLELVEQDENLRPALSTMVSACSADMIDLLWVKGAERTCAQRCRTRYQTGIDLHQKTIGVEQRSP
jgi:hypothetical protein